MKKRQLGVVVMAAGKGTRMKSDRPKVMHKILGEPMLAYVLAAARALAPEKIVIVAGHGREKVEKAFGGARDIEFAVQEKQLGTADAVRAGMTRLKNFDGDVLVLSGDAPLIGPGTLRKMIAARKRYDNVLLAADVDDECAYGRIVRNNDGSLNRIVEALDASPEESEITEVNAGMYVFAAQDLGYALSKITNHNRKKEYYLTDAVGILTGRGKKFGVVTADDPTEIIGINSRDELADATYFLNRRHIERHMRNGVTFWSPETTFVGPNVKIGRDTEVLPYCVMVGEVRIGRGCEVGPFSHLRTGAQLDDAAEIGNFVEMKKARLGAGSKAKHLTYLGDTTIGKKTNIGAGTITANYDGKNKWPTKIGDNAFIGSGCILVAPVRVGSRGMTGAGSLVTRNHDVKPGEVVVGVPARPFKKAGR